MDDANSCHLVRERIDRWLDTIRCSSIPALDRKAAALALSKHVLASEAYFDEAHVQNAGHTLMRALSTGFGDDGLLSVLSSALAACSGTSARGCTVAEYSMSSPRLDRPAIVKVKELSISEGGVGVRVWAAAAVLCREMCTRDASFFKGQHVLELGAGCGVCGVLAERLGAASVTLTDFEGSVLDNLRACVALNYEGGGEEEEEEDSWEYGRMAVRYLNWDDERTLTRAGDMGGERHLTPRDPLSAAFASVPSATPSSSSCPSLPPGTTFPLIVASDVMYERDCCRMLAPVIRRRLSRGGYCIMCNAIRQLVFLDDFCDAAAAVGLRVRLLDVDPRAHRAWDGAEGYSLEVDGVPLAVSGIGGKASDYVAGTKLFLIDREDAPADWGRFSDRLAGSLLDASMAAASPQTPQAAQPLKAALLGGADEAAASPRGPLGLRFSSMSLDEMGGTPAGGDSEAARG